MSRNALIPWKDALCLAVCTALSAGAALAQGTITCPPTVPQGAELRELPELRADANHVLSTIFNVELKPQCVPVQDPTTKAWSYQVMSLRTYVYKDPKTGKDTYGYPGPTFRIRKQEEVVEGKKDKLTPGDRLKILLVNNLPPETTPHGKCDDACAGTNTDCSTITLPTPSQCVNAVHAKPPKILPGCCCLVNQSQAYPECFHGDNTTNLHFHGTHVSPQSPQDFVLLELKPKLPPGTHPPADDHPMDPRGTVAYGQFQYDVDPPPPTQAEGTHWYHPHKHGSVALQVSNGMPGALIIEGKFDDWLRGYYGGKLQEKVLVMQQIAEIVNLYTDIIPPPNLINGQVNPTVHMNPGEVQRWRFVNATMKVAAQVSLNFPPGVQVKQIAMDGVRFSPENYTTQPLFEPRDPSVFKISPGNRADFLVQAPIEPGVYRVTHRLAGKSQMSEGKAEKIRERDQALLQVETARLGAKAAGEGAELGLVTLVVEAPAAKAPQKPAIATGFPPAAQWPPMPWYLKDVPAKTDDKFGLTFEITSQSAPPGPGNPTNQFMINGLQYNPNCSNITTRLGTTDTWFVQNSSVLAHPFHIHINPFQLFEQGQVINGQPVPFVKYASPPWQDTIALPVVASPAAPVAWDVDAGPIWNNDDAKAKCPGVCSNKSGGTWNGNWTTTVPGKMSVCGCQYTEGNGYVLFRHRYLEFTGEYVLHCHFLGHEDRGMMFNVQTVCKDDPTKWGKATPYGQPECVPGNLIPAAPPCPPAAADAGSGTEEHPGGHSIH